MREYLPPPLQAAFNDQLWLPLLGALGLAEGSAGWLAAVRLGSDEYVPSLDVRALREAFAAKGEALA